jgi:hypothetical protein
LIKNYLAVNLNCDDWLVARTISLFRLSARERFPVAAAPASQGFFSLPRFSRFLRQFDSQLAAVSTHF